MPPPKMPAAIPASMYSCIASSLSIGRPACARSISCCVISVGTSVATPTPAPFADLAHRLPAPALSGVKANILPAIPSIAACPPAAIRAFSTLTASSSPASTCSSCLWILPPNRSGKDAAAPPITVPAAVPKGPKNEPIAAPVPAPAKVVPRIGACSPANSPANESALPTPSTS